MLTPAEIAWLWKHERSELFLLFLPLGCYGNKIPRLGTDRGAGGSAGIRNEHYPSISVEVLSVSPLARFALGPVVTPSLHGRSARTLTRAKWRRRNRAKRSRGGKGRKVPKPLCALCDLTGLRFTGGSVQPFKMTEKSRTNPAGY